MKKMIDMPYRDQIRWKVRLLWLLIIGMLAYMVIIAELGGGDSRIQTRLASSFGSVSFFGSLGVAIWRLVHNRRLLKDKLLLKQSAAQRRDERERFLHDKSGGVVVDVLLVCLLFMAMTAAMFSMPAFYTAYAALLLTAALKALVWLVYSRMG